MRSLSVLLALALAGTQVVAADKFPSKPIILIVNSAAGGADVQYRKLAELVGRELGQPVIVENRPGGAGTAALSAMSKMAKPDGYTIGGASGPLLRQPHMMKVNFAPLEDFTWIAGMGTFTFVVTVRDDSPFQTLGDLIAWAKANPGMLTYGTPGAASSQHMAMTRLGKAAGIKSNHIPYKGSAEIQQAVMGGHIMVGANTLAGVVSAANGQHGVRALASFDSTRSPLTPDLPTVKELGYDVVQDSPYGVVGPKGMPPEVVATLQEAFRKAAFSAENAKVLELLRQRLWYLPSDAYTKWAATTFESEREMVQAMNLRESN